VRSRAAAEAEARAARARDAAVRRQEAAADAFAQAVAAARAAAGAFEAAHAELSALRAEGSEGEDEDEDDDEDAASEATGLGTPRGGVVDIVGGTRQNTPQTFSDLRYIIKTSKSHVASHCITRQVKRAQQAQTPDTIYDHSLRLCIIVYIISNLSICCIMVFKKQPPV
jgi:hypothetical protein